MLLSSISKVCFSNIYSKTLEANGHVPVKTPDPDHRADHLKKINQLINQVYFIPKQVRIPRVGQALLKEALPHSLKTSRSSLTYSVMTPLYQLFSSIGPYWFCWSQHAAQTMPVYVYEWVLYGEVFKIELIMQLLHIRLIRRPDSADPLNREAIILTSLVALAPHDMGHVSVDYAWIYKCLSWIGDPSV